MSSTSRSPDDKSEKAAPAEEPAPSKGSPGRYSLADDGDDVPSTRIDSMTRMPAVRAELAAPKSARTSDPGIGPPSIPRPDKGPPSLDAKKKGPPPPPPARPAVPPHATHRAMPAPIAKGAAPAPEKRDSKQPDSKKPDSKKPDSKKPDSKKPDSKKPDSKKPDSKRASGKPAKSAPPEPMRPSQVPARASQAPSRPSQAPVRPSQAPGARHSQPPGSSPPSSRKTSSLRPPSAGERKSLAPPELPLMLDGFDEGSIAFAFDALMSDGPTGQPGQHEFDLAPVRELFSELAANHMRHVRDFMIDVKWGEVTRDWIHICVPPVRTLRRAAEHLELKELGVALEKLGSELEAANAVGGQMLDADEKTRLLDAYGELVTLLPQAFALDRDKTQREAVIVQALLLQVPDVRKVTIDKLHAAGLTSLSVLFEANANDIAHVAGIPDSLAERIVERVQEYRAELKTASPQDARAAEREKLITLNGQLKQHHERYESAQAGWTPEDKASKRQHFRAREETWLEISVLLARLGEVDRLQGIEKVPFTQRIAQLSDYIEEARDKYRTAES